MDCNHRHERFWSALSSGSSKVKEKTLRIVRWLSITIDLITIEEAESLAGHWPPLRRKKWKSLKGWRVVVRRGFSFEIIDDYDFVWLPSTACQQHLVTRTERFCLAGSRDVCLWLGGCVALQVSNCRSHTARTVLSHYCVCPKQFGGIRWGVQREIRLVRFSERQ